MTDGDTPRPVKARVRTPRTAAVSRDEALEVNGTATPANGVDPAGIDERARPGLGDRPEPITAADPLAVAGRKAMWTHLERLLSREASLGDPDRPDELRRYRVAIRRLRAAVRMFGAAYPDREVRPLRRGLADLARAVGAVRDLDLRIADLNRWSLERGGDSRAAVTPLLDAWAADRKWAVASLLARVETRRHRRLVDRLVVFVDARPANERRSRFGGPSTIGDRVASIIWAAYEEVRAYAAVVRWADLETLHDLRIATKRLRDDLEFLADLVGPGRAPLLERLVGLQDHLGAMNDAAVTTEAVRTFLEERHGQIRPAEESEVAAYLADREREVARLKRSSVRPWRAVAGIAFARRLGRVVVVPAGSPAAPSRRRPAVHSRRRPAEAGAVSSSAASASAGSPSAGSPSAGSPSAASPSGS